MTTDLSYIHCEDCGHRWFLHHRVETKKTDFYKSTNYFEITMECDGECYPCPCKKWYNNDND